MHHHRSIHVGEIVNPDGENSAEQLPSSKDPEGLVRLVTLIADRVDPLLKVVTTVMERNLEAEKHETRFRIHMAWIAVTIVGLIVGVASFLTYVGKLDGSTLGFLLGLVVGYVLTFVRDAIEPPKG